MIKNKRQLKGKLQSITNNQNQTQFQGYFSPEQHNKFQQIKIQNGNIITNVQIKNLESLANTQANFLRQRPPSGDRKKELINESIDFQLDSERLEEECLKTKNYHFKSSLLFDKYYKKFDKIQTDFSFKGNKTQKSLIYKLIDSVSNEQKIPMKMKLIQSNGRTLKQSSELNLNHYDCGRYSKFIETGISDKQFNGLSNIQMANANITSLDFKKIIKNCPKQLSTINMSYNKVKSFDNEFTNLKLQIINLEHNSIQSFAGIKLLQQLNQNQFCKKLNLSSNLLNDQFANVLQEFLIQNDTLTELYLHYNQLNNYAGIAIAKGIKNNNFLKVLDLSCNSLGNGSKQEIFAKEMSAAIQQQSSILHLDISFNRIQIKESFIIAEGLKNNQVIYGFHFEGNNDYFYVDENGYLKYSQDPIDPHFNKIRIDGVKPLKVHASTNCWICEGWSAAEFSYNSEFSIKMKHAPIFIHLNFDGFTNHQMENMNQQSNKIQLTHDNEKSYEVSRMIPPNKKVHYFFSCPYDQETDIQEGTQTEEQYNNVKLKFNRERGGSVDFSAPSIMNYTIQPQGNAVICNDWEYEIKTKIKPRTDHLVNFFLQEEKIQQIEAEWNLKNSFFYDFQVDDEAMEKKCFDFDWGKCAIPKIVKSQNDLEEIKNLLWKNYKVIRNVFRHYSSYQPMGEIPAIQFNIFTELFQFAVDKNYKLSDLDLIFISTNSSAQLNKYKYNPDRGIVRFQMIEIIVRIAIDKYYKQGIPLIQSVQKVIEDITPKFQSTPNVQQWRNLYYWNKPCEDVIKSELPKLIDLFNFAISMRELKYFTTKQFITLSTFKQIFSLAGIQRDEIIDRALQISYNSSIQTQIDELELDRNTTQYFKEFVEAIARASQYIVQNVPLTESFQKLLEILFKLLNPFKRKGGHKQTVSNSQSVSVRSIT